MSVLRRYPPLRVLLQLPTACALGPKATLTPKTLPFVFHFYPLPPFLPLSPSHKPINKPQPNLPLRSIIPEPPSFLSGTIYMTLRRAHRLFAPILSSASNHRAFGTLLNKPTIPPRADRLPHPSDTLSCPYFSHSSLQNH